MNFNDHSQLKGSHAFLSPSKYHWINYTDARFEEVLSKHQAAVLGTRIHNVAEELITLRIPLPKDTKTLNLFVNDAIKYGMTPELPLFYSKNAFGTADALKFNNSFLRVHDLKTGTSPASTSQLDVYASLFCLEYGIQPSTIDMELRIYQNDEYLVWVPPVSRIEHVMERIVYFDSRINELLEE